MSAFSFSFSGDDIEESSNINDYEPPPLRSHAAETGTLRRASNSAFPVAGRPLLSPHRHDLESMLKALPPNIAYSTLSLKMDDGKTVQIPRRELWDVRAQLMAEENDEELGNLGADDVRTGVYEGGFKSWESSVDVVKVLDARRSDFSNSHAQVLEVCQNPRNICQVANVRSLGVAQRFLRWHSFNGIWKVHWQNVTIPQVASSSVSQTTTRQCSSWSLFQILYCPGPTSAVVSCGILRGNLISIKPLCKTSLQI